MSKYILSLDAGTTSSRSIIFNHDGEIVSVTQKEFEQIFPQPGWVEHNAEEIWATQISTINDCLSESGISADQLAAIGITNQRETVVMWDRRTGKPVHNAIVWQDRRTAGFCDELKAGGHSELITEKTGLVIDAYFSGTKVKWLLDYVEGLRDRADRGEIAFGTVDTWLIWKLTDGKTHITDVTNASRTLLYNIHTLEWDTEILQLLDIPASILPSVHQSSELMATTSSSSIGKEVPISGIAGDQQAALFGQMCLEPGMIKNTYGTGCFVVANTGSTAVKSKHNLLTTIAWQIDGNVTYAIEGSVFVAGAIVQWLRDELQIINDSSEIEALAGTVKDNGGVTFVPALSGLGAPIWDQYARGAILGLTRGSNRGHIARAALEGIALRVRDVIKTGEDDFQGSVTELRVDGGASVNNLLMQFQADVLQCDVVRPVITETTALGAAYLAGIAVGFWNLDDLKEKWKEDHRFSPSSPEKVNQAIRNWEKALKRAQEWAEE